MSEPRSVAVQIQGHQYRIRSEDEETIQRVARYVDATMTRVRKHTKTVDSRDVAVLAALNLAKDLLAATEGAGPSKPGFLRVEERRLRELIDLIDAAEGA